MLCVRPSVHASAARTALPAISQISCHPPIEIASAADADPKLRGAQIDYISDYLSSTVDGVVFAAARILSRQTEQGATTDRSNGRESAWFVSIDDLHTLHLAFVHIPYTWRSLSQPHTLSHSNYHHRCAIHIPSDATCYLLNDLL